MQTLKLSSLGVLTFTLSMLLAHLSVGYASIRLGTALLWFTLVLLCGSGLWVTGLLAALRGRGGYLQNNDIALASSPAFLFALIAVLAGILGAYTAW